MGDPQWHTEDGYNVVRPRQICDGEGGSTWGCFSPTPLEIGDVAINRTRDGDEWPVEIADEAEEYDPAPWKPRAGRGFFYWTISLDDGPEYERPRRRRKRKRW